MSKTFLYADETTFFNVDSNVDELLAQDSLDSAPDRWFKTNSLLLNVCCMKIKPKIYIFSPRQTRNRFLQITTLMK